MDINCSLFCKYQANGKCKLYDVGTAMLYHNELNDDVDCLYYETEKIPKKRYF